MRHRGPALCLALAASLLVGACSTAELAVHAVKSAADTAPKPGAGGDYKVGDPYAVDGVTYVPREDPAYDQTGVASWYGAEFHGRRTANGDTYDMNALTAAHTTLPMPSKVRVTNLENGRALTLTVNDRGPFVDGRIIDVSRRAAQLLGFEDKGTAMVRVQAAGGAAPDDKVFVADAAPEVTVTAAPGERGEAVAQASAEVHGDVTVAPVAPPIPQPAAAEGGGSFLIRSAAAAEPATPGEAGFAGHSPVPQPAAYFVQGGAFADQDNAARLERRLAAFGPTRITAVEVDEQVLYRVRVGPVYRPEAAQSLLERVLAAGNAGARLVAEAE